MVLSWRWGSLLGVDFEIDDEADGNVRVRPVGPVHPPPLLERGDWPEESGGRSETTTDFTDWD